MLFLVSANGLIVLYWCWSHLGSVGHGHWIRNATKYTLHHKLRQHRHQMPHTHTYTFNINNRSIAEKLAIVHRKQTNESCLNDIRWERGNKTRHLCQHHDKNTKNKIHIFKWLNNWLRPSILLECETLISELCECVCAAVDLRLVLRHSLCYSDRITSEIKPRGTIIVVNKLWTARARAFFRVCWLFSRNKFVNACLALFSCVKESLVANWLTLHQLKLEFFWWFTNENRIRRKNWCTIRFICSVFPIHLYHLIDQFHKNDFGPIDNFKWHSIEFWTAYFFLSFNFFLSRSIDMQN